MNRIASTTLLLAGASTWALPVMASEPVLEEVVVTGSRVIKNGDDSPSPVTVVATEDILTVQPGTLADALNILPVFAGSRGSGSNPTSTGSVSAGNASANQLNLRNIGAVRTLILLDGLRVPPTLINGIVDVDVIPQMLVQRVDTVTGGVSAVYGSDAISGVVNYIIDKKFTGVKAQINGGISDYGDAEKYNAAIAAGTSLFDGRGHVEVSYEYREENGILFRSDREYMNLWGVTGSGTAAVPYVLQSNVRQAGFPFGGLITTGVLANQTFKTNGVLSQFVPGTTTGSTALQIGGDGGYYDSSLLSPLKGHQFFGRLDYEFTDNLTGYFQVGGNIKTNEVYAEYLLLNAVTLSAQNAFLSQTYRDQMLNANPSQTTFRLAGLMQNGPRFSGESESNQWTYTTGLNGSLGDYDWGVDLVHGVTKLNTTLPLNVNNQRLAAALDAVAGPSGPVCYAATQAATASAYANCVPLNVFGPTAANPAAFNYIMQSTGFDGQTNMDDVSAHISGAPFDTWAGPLNAALSGEWRKQSFEGVSTGRPTDVVDCTNIRFGNCTAGGPLWVQTFASTPKVSQDVWETALEFDAPLLKDASMAQALNLNAAVRFTSYNTSGEYWTWKLGLDWQLNDSLRFRATRSSDIRAPTLYDLFAPTNAVFVQPRDELTNTTPRVPSRDESNPGLTAEIGNTMTAGVVWKPTADLSIALDGYRILITDAITPVAGQTSAFQQACYTSGGASPYCSLQSRPINFTNTTPANAVTGWYTRSINLSEIETYGADLEINYVHTLFDRPMNLRFLGAYQPHILYRQPNVVTVDQGGVAFGPLGAAAGPSVRLTGLFRFQPMEKLTVDLMQRWRNAMKLGGDPSQVWSSNHMASFATTNINLAYKTEPSFGEIEYFLNVQNLFNADAPGGAYSGNGTRAGLRDGYAIGDSPLGRYYTVGVNIKM